MINNEKNQKLRAIIRSHKRWDIIFGVVGLLAMSVGILTLAALFLQMVIDGFPRLTADFFHQFPLTARRPVGHPVGLGRFAAGHAGDGDVRDPGRGCQCDLS